ncbi:thrombospondin type 3 repeat-containing protein [Robertkochia aurantiaca]|uniref:thrombospondin type 3 repeat-containing protein n=1 Tax=Robertkochia aurantiaca TaxID=2873700 RepID=UPI001CCE6629|nr:thrombospondin type 3 repeat-containing protein [Robertkochia sp. 3YJGBD-33]
MNRICYLSVLAGIFFLFFHSCSKDDEPQFYTVTVAATPEASGVISIEKKEVVAGEYLTVEAKPYEGYVFESWSDPEIEAKNTVRIKINRNMNFSARFSKADADNDGVPDNRDKCPDTPEKEEVNALGCSEAQKDLDGDGIPNNRDRCPDTAPGESVNPVGCSISQLDEDGDGVPNNRDLCSETPSGASVDALGCTIDDGRTYVPDDGFEEYLIGLGYDDVLDDYVLTENISGITELVISRPNPDYGPEFGDFPETTADITDLTGIEDFTSLIKLTIQEIYSLISIDINTIPVIEELVLSDMNIQDSYDLINNTSLQRLTVDLSPTPGTIKNNSQLMNISISESGFTLGIDDNPMLEALVCSDCGLNELSITNNPDLNALYVGGGNGESGVASGNDIVTITGNSSLSTVTFFGEIETLTFSGSPGLIELNATGETRTLDQPGDLEFGSLDLGDFPALETLYLDGVVLTSLDVSENPYLQTFSLLNHALACVEVNPVQLSAIPAGWTASPTVDYQLDCGD